MAQRARLAVIAGMAFAVAGTAATAEQTDAQKALAWGLIGTWALDCNEPPSRERPYIKYVVSGDKVVQQRDYGDASDSSDIVNVKILDDGIELQIYLTVTNPPQNRFFELVHDGDKSLAKYNRGEDGSYTIKDFTFVATGQPVRPTYRCS
jgi:hypothetical protein